MEVQLVVQERAAHHRPQEEEGEMQAVQTGAAVQQEVVEMDLHQEQ